MYEWNEWRHLLGCLQEDVGAELVGMDSSTANTVDCGATTTPAAAAAATTAMATVNTTSAGPTIVQGVK